MKLIVMMIFKQPRGVMKRFLELLLPDPSGKRVNLCILPSVIARDMSNSNRMNQFPATSAAAADPPIPTKGGLSAQLSEFSAFQMKTTKDGGAFGSDGNKRKLKAQRIEVSQQSQSDTQTSGQQQLHNQDEFINALAKLPLLCSNPSSISHLTMGDMKALLRSNKKMSKEDMRYKLFHLIDKGEFERDISTLKKARSRQQQHMKMLGDQGGGATRADTASATYVVTKSTDSKVWGAADSSMFDVESDVLMQRSITEGESEREGGCWATVSTRDEAVLESGNPEYFMRRLLKLYTDNRFAEVTTVAAAKPPPPRTATNSSSNHEEGRALLYVERLQEAMQSFKQKSDFQPMAVEATIVPDERFELLKDSIITQRCVKLVVFSRAKLGLSIEKLGYNRMVVKHKTESVAPEVSRQVKIGDEIVAVLGYQGDFTALSYTEKISALSAMAERPLILGFAGE
jgi:hypothetical protein